MLKKKTINLIIVIRALIMAIIVVTCNCNLRRGRRLERCLQPGSVAAARRLDRGTHRPSRDHIQILASEIIWKVRLITIPHRPSRDHIQILAPGIMRNTQLTTINIHHNNHINPSQYMGNVYVYSLRVTFFQFEIMEKVSVYSQYKIITMQIIHDSLANDVHTLFVPILNCKSYTCYK